MMHDLQQLRADIDALDVEILALLSRRAACAQAVGALKRATEGETETIFYRPERERDVLERVQAMNNGPLPDHEVARLFREIMSACLALEHPMTIAYLGPEGTFTQAAALKQFGDSVQTRPKKSISDVFKAVETGDCHYGIVPVENSTEGMVTHTLDMFVQSALSICGEVQLRIAQNLLTHHAGELTEITRVYSHSQSLAQCRSWLAENLPTANQIIVASNAEAARLAAEDRQAAAIAGKIAATQYQLPVRVHNIEDDSNNTTRFLVIGKPQHINPSGHDKTTILVSSQNQSGSLYKLLEPISRHNVNMTRIESRPSKQGIWEYVFFIDLVGHQNNDNLRQLFDELQAKASLFKILGSYPVGGLKD